MGLRLMVGVWVMALALETLAFAGAAPDSEAASGQPWRDADPTWQASSSLSGRRYSLQYPDVSTDGTALDLDMTLTRYLAPLRDDGAPYSLRPFLQRSSAWSLSLTGGRFSTRNPFGDQDRTNWSGGISGSLDVYVKRWLALNGGLGYGYSALHDGGIDQSSHSLDAFVEVGLRLADTRIDAWYGLDALDAEGSGASLRRRFGASAFTVIAHRFTLNASGTVIPSGMEGTLSLEYFATRELGIFAGTFAGRGKLYSGNSLPTRYAGWIGLAAWLDPTVGINATYELTLEDLNGGADGLPSSGYHEVSHAVTFGAMARFDEL